MSAAIFALPLNVLARSAKKKERQYKLFKSNNSNIHHQLNNV